MTGDRPIGPATTEVEIEAERVSMLFRQTPMAAVVAAVNATLMTAIILGTEGDRRALAWLTAMLLVAALRGLAVRAWRRDPAARAHVRRWAWIGMAGAFAAGLVLGGGAIWLWPQSETRQLFWVFLVGGMCAGAAGLHHAHFPTLLAFVLPACLPFVARYALDGTERGLGAAAMILVFIVAVSASTWRSGRRFRRQPPAPARPGAAGAGTRRHQLPAAGGDDAPPRDRGEPAAGAEDGGGRPAHRRHRA